MKYKSFLLLVVTILCFVTKSFSQKGQYQIRNGFGISGGMSQYDINTDNFKTKAATGFLGGLRASVDLPHKWYNLSYGMQFSENQIEISGRPDQFSLEEDYIKYKLLAVSLDLSLHVKLIKNYLMIDIGPMLQFNGPLEFKDEDQEGYFINNYDHLTAKDITKLSKFHMNGVVGASVGVRNFMLKGQYIYGFTNILNKLNKEKVDNSGGKSKFEGHQQMLTLSAIVTF
ncbi:outer membrane beta-barrel protein [Tamlana haliotis]|uniref:Outer membrane beta-barrel protein n=1 Tax=Pseudotamlana haliotis TaxID=2614804 RepID=A0A6N6MC38_9FLAO|nr:outer membrane beta-barrel protein [Tamlana haliotis]KAB1066770.1 outer membrane beta-barrel protein [Tamlana haliotis]